MSAAVECGVACRVIQWVPADSTKVCAPSKGAVGEGSSMTHATRIGRLVGLAVGLGIGAALAATPGIASADDTPHSPMAPELSPQSPTATSTPAWPTVPTAAPWPPAMTTTRLRLFFQAMTTSPSPWVHTPSPRPAASSSSRPTVVTTSPRFSTRLAPWASTGTISDTEYAEKRERLISGI